MVSAAEDPKPSDQQSADTETPAEAVHAVLPTAAAVFKCPCGGGSVITDGRALQQLQAGNAIVQTHCNKCRALLKFDPFDRGPLVVPAHAVPQMNRHARRAAAVQKQRGPLIIPGR